MLTPAFRRTALAWLALGMLSACGNILGIERFSPADDAGGNFADSPTLDASADSAVPSGADDEPPRDAGANALVDARPGTGHDADSAASGPDADAAPQGGCTREARQCVGDAVATCASNGQWSEPVACTTSQRCVAGACTSFPSCAPGGAGLNDCSASRESCCNSLSVTGGSYHRLYTSSATGVASGLAAPASVSGFRLDKYMVTVGRFRQFVAAWNDGYMPPVGSGKHTHLNAGAGVNMMGGGHEPGWSAAHAKSIAPTHANLTCDTRAQAWTDEPSTHEGLPINCVNWAEAYAFCIWDGGFLPSEAEWAYVAAGGSEQRRFPWGAMPPGTANKYAIYACLYPDGPLALGVVGVCNGTNLAPVGTPTLGAGRWGQLDLVGELWEWNLDFDPGMGLPNGYGEPCTDCAYLTMAENRHVRGSQFEDAENTLLSTHRMPAAPEKRYGRVGIRCARAP